MLEHINSSKCRRLATTTAPFNANTLQRHRVPVNAICKALLHGVCESGNATTTPWNDVSCTRPSPTYWPTALLPSGNSRDRDAVA